MTPALDTSAALAIGAALGALLSALLTALAIVYARRRSMLDLPGRRRSHDVPTPRGGGIAIVAALLAAVVGLVLVGALETRAASGFGVGLLLVAAVGWIDDHRGLSVRARLVVHFAAAALLVASLPSAGAPQDGLAGAAQVALQVLLLASAVNFWNFIDGINGLVASQSAWIAAVLVVAFGLVGAWPWAMLAAVFGGACLGFLPFNFPRARIFLGDVGSGGLGFACGALLLVAVGDGALPAWSALLVASAMALDAGLTLLSRMLRGRRWYTAHREHLYQWMVRSGLSHAQTTSIYFIWNLMLVLPLLWISQRHPPAAPFALGLALLAGATAWSAGKRGALGRVGARRSRGRG